MASGLVLRATTRSGLRRESSEMEVMRSHDDQQCIRGAKKGVCRITKPSTNMTRALTIHASPLPASDKVATKTPVTLRRLTAGRGEAQIKLQALNQGRGCAGGILVGSGGDLMPAVRNSNMQGGEPVGTGESAPYSGNLRSSVCSVGGGGVPPGTAGGRPVMAVGARCVVPTIPFGPLHIGKVPRPGELSLDDGRGPCPAAVGLVGGSPVRGEVALLPSTGGNLACFRAGAGGWVGGRLTELVDLHGGGERFAGEATTSGTIKQQVVASGTRGVALTGGAASVGGYQLGKTLVVGVAFMAKKMDSMAKIFSGGAVDGVEFRPLELNRRLAEQDRGACGEGGQASWLRVDIILHKLSEDIMFRSSRVESEKRIGYLEDYISRNPGTSMVDPIQKVARVINRVDTLKVLQSAYSVYGSSGGMPCPPHYMVLSPEMLAACHSRKELARLVAKEGLSYPVICKPIQACGTRGSHTMLLIFDESGLADITAPIVVQEHCNHNAKLYKVCVVGDEVRVCERPSLPNLPPGLTGSFTFDSQKPYPTLEQVKAASAAHRTAAMAASTKVADCSTPEAEPTIPPLPLGSAEGGGGRGGGGCSVRPRPQVPGVQGGGGGGGQGGNSRELTTGVVPPELWKEQRGAAQVMGEGHDPRGERVAGASSAGAVVDGSGVLTQEMACRAAERLREAFGLSIFGFDIIMESGSGDAMVIDVNYFPSFKDLEDFPGVLRRHLKAVAAKARAAAAAPA